MSELLDTLPQYVQTAPHLAFIAAYLGGLLASAEPCLYTVIPITVGFIGARARGSRRTAFLLSLVYVLGLATTYTALGLVAATTGSLFGRVSANPWVNIALANILLLLGLSMLDVFSLPRLGFSGQAGGNKGAFLTAYGLGLTSGFVAGPCTAAALGILLAFAATSGNALYGGSLLFVFSLGLGTLILVAGTFVGVLTSLPKPGPWMEKIRRFFGWFTIAVAEYFLINGGRHLFP